MAACSLEQQQHAHNCEDFPVSNLPTLLASNIFETAAE